MSLDVALSILLIFCAACYLLLGTRLVTSRRRVGTMPVGVMFIVISIWVMGGAIELMSTSFYVFSIGRTCHFIGTALAPVATYIWCREYTGTVSQTRTVVLLLIIPVVSVTLAATNQYHEFMWLMPALSETGEYLTRPEAWGPWFLYMHAPYSYVLVFAAMMTLLMHRSNVAQAHRRGLLLLVWACVGPLLATAAYDLGLGPQTVSFVPFAFAAMLPIYAWLVLAEQVVEFTPFAYETVFQNMQDPVVVLDDRGRIIGLNRRAEHLLKMNENEALRTPLESVLVEGSTAVLTALQTQTPQKMMTSTGRFLHVQVSRIESEHDPARGGRVLMFRDVSDVEKAQSEVRASEKLLRTLIDHSVNGVIRLRWIDDESGQSALLCIFANTAAGRFVGAEPTSLVSMSGEQILRLAMTGMEPDAMQTILEQFQESTETGSSVDVEIFQGDATHGRWLRMICEPVGDDIAVTFIDVTDNKAKERQMESIAWSDPLTGVLNRRGFERDATQRLSESDDDATGALLFVDLNGFKDVNDKYGHTVGDQLLTVAAARLRKSLRTCDIIGRPGGDEFVALVPDVSAQVADNLARRLAGSLEQPYNIGSETLVCAASIGLALYPKNASTLTGLMREADQAMYRAKARCRGVANVSGEDLLEKAI